MSDGISYSSADAKVLEVWAEYQISHDEMRERRKALMDKYDRPLMVRRDWDNGTRVVGFSKGDKPYDEKAFKVVNYTCLEPRMSTKAGKAIAAELAEFTEVGIDLPGMPKWFIGGGGGIRVYAPAMFEHEGTVWLYWASEPDQGVDSDLWTARPLSAFYAAKEAHEASEVE